MDCLVDGNQCARTPIGPASNFADGHLTSLAPVLTMLRIRFWQKAPDQIPMPGISPRASAWILQRLELEARFG
jgi:hypothetical protein